eukprot:CAMPEP_0197454288 /NCGR_PEP_ID=MMETSP1175-20131217/37500_1 /TAXON_ID=1003142 /ORGANISM="Triceratium dubium, Strain CCMP147" /LENGTH=92 /DNA_ID=CAMNT_0042987839 /DNA_START=33 /DNA_END=308 /DNA_ORIENTATION=+
MGGSSAVKGYMPHLMKVWKSYNYTVGMTTRTISPFNVDVVGSLFRNAGGKLKHKVVDNAADVLPGILFGIGTYTVTNQVRKSHLMATVIRDS